MGPSSRLRRGRSGGNPVKSGTERGSAVPARGTWTYTVRVSRSDIVHRRCSAVPGVRHAEAGTSGPVDSETTPGERYRREAEHDTTDIAVVPRSTPRCRAVGRSKRCWTPTV